MSILFVSVITDQRFGCLFAIYYEIYIFMIYPNESYARNDVIIFPGIGFRANERANKRRKAERISKLKNDSTEIQYDIVISDTNNTDSIKTIQMKQANEKCNQYHLFV